MKEITKFLYQQHIPKCCKLQTAEEHEEVLMVCWGLVSSIENDYEMKCGICEFNKENSSEKT